MSSTEGTVCDLCLLAHPEKIQLISLNCLYKEEHRDRKRLVLARWSAEKGRLVRVSQDGRLIRPLPNVSLSSGRRFVLCKPGFGRICKGETCPFAHSLEEKEEWNRKLEERTAIGTSQSFAKSERFSSGVQPPYSTQHNQPRSASVDDAYSYVHGQHTDSHSVQPGRKRHHTQPEPLVTPSGVSAQFMQTPLVKLLPDYHQFNPSQTYPQSQSQKVVHSESRSTEKWPSFAPVHHTDQQPTLETHSVHTPYNSTQTPHVHSAVPHQQIPQHTQNLMPTLSTAATGSLGNTGTIATPTRSMTATQTSQQQASANVHQPKGAKHKKKVSITEKPDAPNPEMYLPLSNENYQTKFRELLKCEETTHGGILKHRCNGKYKLVLHQVGLKKPAWLQQGIPEGLKRFGYLVGLNGDQIAYAVQAAQDRDGVVITHHGNVICKANILPENYSSTEEKFHIAFDHYNHEHLQQSVYKVPRGQFTGDVDVVFDLKHSYFMNLQRSISWLNLEIINRLLPDEKSFGFQLSTSEVDLCHYTQSCSPDQIEALRAIASCPSPGPPILITGPFGTGKTYTLAIAADYIFRTSISSKHQARVLVCTQQRASADNFFECYQNLETTKLKGHVETYIIRDYGYHSSSHRHLYRSVRAFRENYTRNSRRKTTRYLLVTTCLTAPRLADVLEKDFFTHILIDEGAQMREPEAVAPLCLANRNTKIVIAGDQHQVGPAILVLGPKAQQNGLAVSLLERLHKLYKSLGEVARHHHVTLVTNYRCHKNIFSLSGGLFYETPLKVPDNGSSPPLHPQYPYPLVFICSSVDDKVKRVDQSTNQEEIAVIINTIERIVKTWPAQWGHRDLSQLCIMSPSRSQLTLASNTIDKTNKRLKHIRRLPTYDMQGKEFRALFLSTSEPTEDDCYSRNPTKSFCDPFVFNTAITRAQSLVVAVGNPFLLLKTEEVMVHRYGEKGRCWSSYLRACLRNNTLFFGHDLNLSQEEKEVSASKLRELVKIQNQIQTASPIPQKKEPLSSLDSNFPPLKATSLSHQQQVTASSHQKLPTAEVQPQVVEAQVPLESGSDSVPTSTSSSAESSSSPENTIPQLSNVTEEPVKEKTAAPPIAVFSRFENDYENLGELGKGGFGVVYHVRNKLAKQDFALKVIKLRNNEEKMSKEVQALASLVHPHIVRFHHAWTEKAPENWKENQHWSALQSSQYLPSSVPFENGVSDSSAHRTPTSADTPSDTTEQSVGANESDSFTVEFKDSNSDKPEVTLTVDQSATVRMKPVCDDRSRSLEIERPLCLFIQTELCEKNTLRDWLVNNVTNRKRKTVIKFFESILDALVYIHKMKLVHRDLKPSNIFFARTIDNSANQENEPLIKIGDFGLVTGTINPDLAALKLSGDGKQQQSQSSSGYQAGTFFYMSPEQRTSKRCDQKADMYALGVTFFELNCPFKTDSERVKVLNTVRENGVPEAFAQSDAVPTAITEIIKSLLVHDPAQRPSAEELTKRLQENQILKKLKKKAKKKDIQVLDI